MADEEQKEKIEQMIKELDKDGNGLLDKDELKAGISKIYNEINFSVTDEDIERMILSADVNKDGKINLEELKNLL